MDENKVPEDRQKLMQENSECLENPPQELGLGFDRPGDQGPTIQQQSHLYQPVAPGFPPLPPHQQGLGFEKPDDPTPAYQQQAPFYQPAPGFQPLPPQQQGYGYDQPPQYPGYNYHQPGQPVVVTQPQLVGTPIITHVAEQIPVQIEDVNDHLGFSIFVCICCCWLIGIFAIIKSCAASEQKKLGNYPLAKHYGMQAKRLACAGLAVGLIILVVNIIVVAVRIVLIEQQNNGANP